MKAVLTLLLLAQTISGAKIAGGRFSSAVPSGPLAITTSTCPSGTQSSSYAGCTIVATGGTPPYTFSLDTTGTYAPLPEGLTLSTVSNQGVISTSQIGGQGEYITGIIATDHVGATAEAFIPFEMQGSNAFLSTIFPSNSIFHHRVDAATTSLPVDTSPAAPIFSAYLPAVVTIAFGTSFNNFPWGDPAIQVPCLQTYVPVATTQLQSYFTSGPIPANAPVEGTATAVGTDQHVLVYSLGSCISSSTPALWEMWQGAFVNPGWTDASNALWPDTTSNALTTQGKGTANAAGLPISPLILNADEVIGTGTPTTPNGTVQHPIIFTVNFPLSNWVWPATASSAQLGSQCLNGATPIPQFTQISQSSPPSSCTWSGPFGEIYRLKASVSTPSCASSSPQAAILITALRNYGIIMGDGGTPNGSIEGTPDTRWNHTDLACVQNLHLSDFEPVNVSSLIVSNSSGQTSH